jgi:hypothetical protein
MSMASSREEAGRDDGAPDGMPEENGWSLWASGSCSITRCIDRPVAAIERSRGVRRPPYWQAYCEEHARARGVERRADELFWTTEFLQPRSRHGNLRAEQPAES